MSFIEMSNFLISLRNLFYERKRNRLSDINELIKNEEYKKYTLNNLMLIDKSIKASHTLF